MFNRAILEPGYTVGSLSADRRFGPLLLTVTGTRLAEEHTLLGARFSDALGSGGATSWFADAGAPNGLELYLQWMASTTGASGFISNVDIATL